MGSFLTLAGQGARPSFKRHRPAVSQRESVDCITADLAPKGQLHIGPGQRPEGTE